MSLLLFSLMACSGDGLLRVNFNADCDDYVSLSVGEAHSCGVLIDGTLQCWGDTSFLPDALPQEGWLDVASGAQHVCARDTQQRVSCWGDIDPPSEPDDYLSVTAAADFACGLRVNAEEETQLTCWGASPDDWVLPSELGARVLDVGPTSGCAILEDETIECWGDLASAPIPDAAPWLDVTVGSDHACGVPASADEDAVLCWGDATQEAEAPAELTRGVVQDISAGDGLSCATSNYGQLLCWGDTPLADLAPTDLYSMEAIALSADAAHACGVTREGPARCWGDDGQGQASHP